MTGHHPATNRPPGTTGPRLIPGTRMPGPPRTRSRPTGRVRRLMDRRAVRLPVIFLLNGRCGGLAQPNPLTGGAVPDRGWPAAGRAAAIPGTPGPRTAGHPAVTSPARLRARGRGTPGSLDRRAAAAEPGPPSGLPRRGPEGDGPGPRDRRGGLAAAPRYTPGDGYQPAPASPPGLRPEPGAGRSEPRDGRSAPAAGWPGSPAGRSEPGDGQSAPAGGWPESRVGGRNRRLGGRNRRLGGQEPPVGSRNRRLGRCPGERRAAGLAGTLATRTATIRIRRPRPQGTAAPWTPGRAARAAGPPGRPAASRDSSTPAPGPAAVRCVARPAAPQGSGARCPAPRAVPGQRRVPDRLRLPARSTVSPGPAPRTGTG